MADYNYPKWFSDCMMTNEEAMQVVVKSGTGFASGFATSEPHTFYTHLWDFIQKHDIHDLRVLQALYMAPHPFCVGDALSSKGMFVDAAKSKGLFGGIARKANQITQKLEGLKKLIGHYEEMKERRIKMVCPFIGAATNIVIPSNPITNMLYPEYVNRNTTRMGVTDMQSVHFSDAVDSMGYDPDRNPKVESFVCVMTPPNEEGELSHGPANGANGEIVDQILEFKNVNLLLYINKKYPFTKGYKDARNTIPIDDFKGLAEAGRLFVVEDDSKIPCLPAGSFDNPNPKEVTVAENVVNHIESHLEYTKGRAIQVGFGNTGVLAIRALKDSSWSGRSYTEMLETFTLDLWEAGKLSGSHFIMEDGTREQIDGKMVCTFSLGEEGSDFYDRLSNNDAMIVAAASRVVIPEGFHFGMGINNCLGIDFHGHVNSGSRGMNHHSGIGGAANIARGLLKGGLHYLCMKSTHTGLDGTKRSSIFPFFPTGTVISHIGPDLMGGRSGARVFLSTEYGIVQLSGCSQSEFVRRLISIAHPDFRDWLKDQAYRHLRIVV